MGGGMRHMVCTDFERACRRFVGIAVDPGPVAISHDRSVGLDFRQGDFGGMEEIWNVHN